MSIARRLGVAYASISIVCVLVVGWLGYHEFIEEPAEYAAMRLGNIHKDVVAELSAVGFLALIPVLLGLGWWWMRRVLAPLEALSVAVGKIDSHNLRRLLPRTHNGDEVDRLAAGFNSMTQRLDDSFRRIHEFTLHASHELKTPLTVMRMQLETAIRENGSLPPSQSAYFDAQLEEVRRLTQIVDALTLLTKADAGLVPLERRAVSLDEIVNEAFEDALILAQPQKLMVTLTRCDFVKILGDRHRLRQLLLILTDNAVKYNQPGGSIALSLQTIDDGGELRITNTGADFSDKTLGAVFDRFVRGENAQGSVDGCGLGLTIAQWIVHAHEGTIQLLKEKDHRFTALVRFPSLAAQTQLNPDTVTHPPNSITRPRPS